jgi:hypothetical protein
MKSTKTDGTAQGAALMRPTAKYVGLDVHQATTLASVRDGRGRVMARSILATEESAILEWFSGMRSPAPVARAAYREFAAPYRADDLPASPAHFPPSSPDPT